MTTVFPNFGSNGHKFFQTLEIVDESEVVYPFVYENEITS